MNKSKLKQIKESLKEAIIFIEGGELDGETYLSPLETVMVKAALKQALEFLPTPPSER